MMLWKRHSTITPQYAWIESLFERRFPLAPRVQEELEEDLADVAKSLHIS